MDRHRLTLQDWVTEGNPLQRLHARFRLAQPNAPPKPIPAPVAPPLVITPRTRDLSRQLIVAAYHEDLAWLSDVECDVLVYHKGGACPEGVPCQRLPNTQRETGTMLYHIVTRWDHLAPLTIFCQGWPFDHSPDFLGRLSLPYDRPTSLTTRYQPEAPADWIKDHDLVESHHGLEIRYGDAWFQAHPGIPVWFDPKAWDYVFDGPMPRPLWFGYGATWAVPRESILARPRAFYAHLLEVCDSGASGQSHTDPPVNPWSMEALWRYLWADPAEYPHRVHWICRHRSPIAGCSCFHCDRFHRKAPIEVCQDCEDITL